MLCVCVCFVMACSSSPGPHGGTPGAEGGERCGCGGSEGCEADHFGAGRGEEGMGTHLHAHRGHGTHTHTGTFRAEALLLTYGEYRFMCAYASKQLVFEGINV